MSCGALGLREARSEYAVTAKAHAISSKLCPSAEMVPLLLALASGAATPPKALLINLPRHSERFRNVKQQLEAAGVDYERAEAVDGKALSDADLKANSTLLARKLTTRGMIGCFLSHRACWRRCVDAADGPVLGARNAHASCFSPCICLRA